MKASIDLRPVRESDIESFREAVNGVCAERRYVATINGFSLEQTRAFIGHIIKESLPQIVAIDCEKVIGWCDILPSTVEGFTHVGRLGMGVVKPYRGQGIGRRLLKQCLDAARTIGIEKVELEVYSDNLSAIRLYESESFEIEGLRRRARKLDGEYQDIQLMCLQLTDKD